MKLSVKERLHNNPGQFIEQEIKDFVRNSPANRLPFLDDYILFDEPLVRFADGDDPIFTEYKKIIGPVHLTPREALAQACNRKPEDLPERISVISWILPAVEETRKSHRAETRVPSRLWVHTRWYGEKCNEQLRAHLVELLVGLGYLAVAPGVKPYVKMYDNEKGMYSNWSERHVAYASGLGTFGLSDGLITEKGIAHRCGSVVTTLVLPPSTRMASSPYSNCLAYKGVGCRACIERCPAGAISDKGHDKIKCHKYVMDIGYSKVLESGFDNDKSVVGCGFCQTKVPCEFKNPVKKLKKKPG